MYLPGAWALLASQLGASRRQLLESEMKVFVIPVKDKFILYRPLLQLAFVGNRSMADLALDLAIQASTANATEGAPEDVLNFLRAIGFLKPDPSPPPVRQNG